jgi:hypothetical protein
MHNDIPHKDVLTGWFGTYQRCCYGGEIFEWLLQVVDQEQSKARSYCQKMLELEIIAPIKQHDQFGMTELY